MVMSASEADTWMSTRKVEVLQTFEIELIRRIKYHVKRPGSNSEVYNARHFLAFCFYNKLYTIAIVFSNVLLDCPEFRAMYSVWAKLHGKNIQVLLAFDRYHIQQCPELKKSWGKLEKVVDFL